MFGSLRAFFEEEERYRIQEMQRIQPHVNWSGRVDIMSKYSSREQARNLKWQEKQRKQIMEAKARKGQSPSQSHVDEMKSLREALERSRAQMNSSPFHISIGSGLIRPETEEEKAQRERERLERIKKKEAEAQEKLDRIYAMPGLDHIRTQVEEMIALKKVAKLREEAGLKCEQQSLHMAFLGNPGTGKTTVARLVGEAFILLGLLKSDKETPPFVQVVQSDVISPYVGGAERNIREKFAEARGGILFIDEAYALNGPYEWNKNMLAAIVSCVEDMKDEVLCIVAGYNDEMQEFFDANPGMRSRFPSHINFPDYELGPLLEIADMIAADRDYVINGAARTALMKRFEGEKKLKSFGNARTVRNVIEAAIRKHSARMIGIAGPTRDTLMTLTPLDIDTEVKIPVNTGKAKKLEHVTITMTQQLKQNDLDQDPWGKGKVH